MFKFKKLFLFKCNKGTNNYEQYLKEKVVKKEKSFYLNWKNNCKKLINKMIIGITNYRFIILSKKSRISLYILSTEPRIRDLLANKLKKNYKYIFINPNLNPNKYLQYKYSKYVNFINLKINHSKGINLLLKSILLRFFSLLDTGEDPKVNFISSSILQWYCYKDYWQSHKPVITFNNLEIKKVLKTLPKDLDLNKPIVILNFREANYYEQLKIINSPRIGNQTDKEFNYRNPKFCDYLLTINWLVSQGYLVLKCGISAKKIPFKINGFYDLSNSINNYDELQHLYLCSISKFHINGACGHQFFSLLFNTPSICTHDYTPSTSPVITRVSVPSRYYDKNLKRNLTYTEQLEKININKPISENLKIIHPSDKEIQEATIHFCTHQLQNKKLNKTEQKLKDKLNNAYTKITKEKNFPFSITWASKYEHLFE